MGDVVLHGVWVLYGINVSETWCQDNISEISSRHTEVLTTSLRGHSDVAI